MVHSKMSSNYLDRYNERRPTIGFRISPEIKERLLELQDNSGKTLGEIAENVLTDALMFPNKNPKNSEYENYFNRQKNNNNDENQSNSNSYDNGFKNGYKLGNNHAKNNIKNRINGNLKSFNGELNNLIKNHLENSKDECAKCGNKFINEDFNFCPHCGVEFNENNEQEKIDPLLDFSNVRIPIISDILEFLGLEKEDSSGEDSSGEDSRREDKQPNFVGGTKNINKKTLEKDQYQCYKCGFTSNSTFNNCPECGSRNNWD